MCKCTVDSVDYFLEHQERLFNSLDLSLGQHQEGLFDCLNHRWDSTKKGVFNCSIHRWDTSSTNSGCLIAWICNSGNKKKGLFDCLSHRWDSTKKGVFNFLDRRWGGVLTARNLDPYFPANAQTRFAAYCNSLEGPSNKVM